MRIFNVNTSDGLREAITIANGDGGQDTINLVSNISLLGDLPLIHEPDSLTINGNGYTISRPSTSDTANSGRFFFIKSGTVNINFLTFSQGVAQGESGAGGGGAGLGGALFIYDGNVAISYSSFENNKAIGGSTNTNHEYISFPIDAYPWHFRGNGGGGGSRGGSRYSYFGYGYSNGGHSGFYGGAIADSNPINGSNGGNGGNGGFGGGGGFGGTGGANSARSTSVGYQSEYVIGKGGNGGNGGNGGFGGGGGAGGNVSERNLIFPLQDITGALGYNHGGNGGNGGNGGFGGGGGNGGTGNVYAGNGGNGGFGGGGGAGGIGFGKTIPSNGIAAAYESEGGKGGFGGGDGGPLRGIYLYDPSLGLSNNAVAGAGAGFGGAIFVRSGTLTLTKTSFSNNSATGGLVPPSITNGTGEIIPTVGGNGKGLGGAIFAFSFPTTDADPNGNRQGFPSSTPTILIGPGVTFFNNSATDVLSGTIPATDAKLGYVFNDANLYGDRFAYNKDATFLSVTNTNDSGLGSLRQAILNANATLGKQTIVFDIPGTGTHTIAPLSNLPNITVPVIIDGRTQPGFSGSPLIELTGRNSSNLNGLGLLSQRASPKLPTLVGGFSCYTFLRLLSEGKEVLA